MPILYTINVTAEIFIKFKPISCTFIDNQNLLEIRLKYCFATTWFIIIYNLPSKTSSLVTLALWEHITITCPHLPLTLPLTYFLWSPFSPCLLPAMDEISRKVLESKYKSRKSKKMYSPRIMMSEEEFLETQIVIRIRFWRFWDMSKFVSLLRK